MEALEQHETIEHAAHGHHAHGRLNRRIGLMIAVLAALLAVAEAAGKSVQTDALNHNLSASDLWAFYQAKAIRRTTLQTAAEGARIELAGDPSPERRAAIEKQVAAWNQTAARYESDPETGEGRKELAARAKAAEAARDHALASYHLYEYGAAAFQLAIVLASATVITGFVPLAWISAGVGALGVVVSLLGWLVPEVLHFGH